jgi:hypothetical protein
VKVNQIAEITGDRNMDRIARAISEVLESFPEVDDVRGMVMLIEPEKDEAIIVGAGYGSPDEAIRDAERLPTALRGGE